MDNIFCAVDIGSSKIVALVAQKVDKDSFSILGWSIYEGETRVKQGIISDIAWTSRIVDTVIKDALNEANFSSDTYIDKEKTITIGDVQLIVNVGAYKIKSTHLISSKKINFQTIQAMRDRVAKERLTNSDEALKEALNQWLEPMTSNLDNLAPSETYPYLHYVHLGNKIVECEGISDLSRASFEGTLLTSPKVAIQNIIKSLSDKGYKIHAIIATPLASAMALTPALRENKNFLVLDMGEEFTSVSSFRDGKLNYTDTIAFAGSLITKEIMQEFSLSKVTSEKLKLVLLDANNKVVAPAFRPLIELFEPVDKDLMVRKIAHIIKNEWEKIIHSRVFEKAKRIVDESTRQQQSLQNARGIRDNATQANDKEMQIREKVYGYIQVMLDELILISVRNLENLFDKVFSKIYEGDISFDDLKDGIYLTGGVSNIPNITNFAWNVFYKKYFQIYKDDLLNGDEGSQSLASQTFSIMSIKPKSSYQVFDPEKFSLLFKKYIYVKNVLSLEEMHAIESEFKKQSAQAKETYHQEIIKSAQILGEEEFEQIKKSPRSLMAKKGFSKIWKPKKEVNADEILKNYSNRKMFEDVLPTEEEQKAKEAQKKNKKTRKNSDVKDDNKKEKSSNEGVVEIDDVLEEENQELAHTKVQVIDISDEGEELSKLQGSIASSEDDEEDFDEHVEEGYSEAHHEYNEETSTQNENDVLVSDEYEDNEEAEITEVTEVTGVNEVKEDREVREASDVNKDETSDAVFEKDTEDLEEASSENLQQEDSENNDDEAYEEVELEESVSQKDELKLQSSLSFTPVLDEKTPEEKDASDSEKLKEVQLTEKASVPQGSVFTLNDYYKQQRKIQREKKIHEEEQKTLNIRQMQNEHSVAKQMYEEILHECSFFDLDFTRIPVQKISLLQVSFMPKDAIEKEFISRLSCTLGLLNQSLKVDENIFSNLSIHS